MASFQFFTILEASALGLSFLNNLARASAALEDVAAGVTCQITYFTFLTGLKN